MKRPRCTDPGPLSCACWLTHMLYWHTLVERSHHECYELHLCFSCMTGQNAERNVFSKPHFEVIEYFQTNRVEVYLFFLSLCICSFIHSLFVSFSGNIYGKLVSFEFCVPWTNVTCGEMECDWLYENVTPLNEDGFVVISMYCFTPLYSLRHLSLMACKEPLMIHNSTVVAVINIIEEKKYLF